VINFARDYIVLSYLSYAHRLTQRRVVIFLSKVELFVLLDFVTVSWYSLRYNQPQTSFVYGSTPGQVGIKWLLLGCV